MIKTAYPGQPSLMHTYYPYTDHLGSVNTLLENGANGLTTIHEQAFDPWGRRRNVYNWVADDNAVPPANIARWLRGFTGHEHLDAFALVNMNARLYDPKLGRMLSVDNFVSVPSSAMGYNRYSYANNNPLKYTDPSGNFLWSLFTAAVDFWTQGFNGGFDITKGWSRMSESWAKFDPTRRGSKTHNAVDIDLGRFQSDENLTFFGRVWQVIEKNTVNLAGETFGYVSAQIANLTGRVESVNYFHGTTVMQVPDLKGEFANTKGSYIKIRQYDGIAYQTNGDLTEYSSVLIHEYGHYLQLRKFGTIATLLGAATTTKLFRNPSIISANYTWFELDADARGAAYFERHGYRIQNYRDRYGFYNRKLNRLTGLEIFGAFNNPFSLLWNKP